MSNMTYTQVAFSGVSGSDGQGQSGQMTVPMGGLLAARFRAHDRLTGSTDRQQFRGCRKSTYRCRKNALTDFPPKAHIWRRAGGCFPKRDAARSPFSPARRHLMRCSSRLSATVLLVAAAGCYHATVETGLTPSNQTVEKSFAAAWIAGLGPP